MKAIQYLTFLLLAGFRVASYADVTLVPTPDASLPIDGTVVFCPTFLAAWSGLKATVGGNLEMEDPPDLVSILNSSPFPSNAVPEEAFLAFGGRLNAGVVDNLRAKLEAKFGAAAPNLPADLVGPQTVFIAYSHLQRILPFPRKYMRSERIALRFKTGEDETAVQFFGSTERDADHYSGQTEVVHWRSDAEFTLRLRSRHEGESIVLAKMERPDQLATAIAHVRTQLKSGRKQFQTVTAGGKEQQLLSYLGQGDLLAIPVIDLSVATNFTQVCGHELTNPGFKNTFLERAYQNVLFHMDERGAVVRSTAYGRGDFGGPLRSTMPRRFIFDRPFLLSLWREQAESPYLAIWIGSSDVMLPFPTQKGTTR